MTLSDRDILELAALCDAVIDENASPAEIARLTHLIAESVEARKYYIRTLDQSASLGHYASEMQIDAPDLVRRVGSYGHYAKWMFLAVAASLLLGTATWLFWPVTAESTDSVAKITGVQATVWVDASDDSKLGALLAQGQNVALQEGFAEVTFDSGAVVVVEGPAELSVNSAWDATLRRGAITATVPSQAIGFRISNPAVEVVDLGTEFSMVADELGTTNVFVIQGEVEAMPGNSSDREAILLRENESRRFAASGVSNLEIAPPEFRRSGVPLTFQRVSSKPKFVQWSFDEVNGTICSASAFDLPADQYKLTLTKRMAQTAHAAGFRGDGLNFNGKVFARAKFPGLSSNLPRTVNFWVQVPKNAALSGAYSMVAWRADSNKLGSRPVHICWNRNPEEGPLGALRTDFSGGHAMGMTSLRDGQWHYVSVVFMPGMDPNAPVQVKQYVDGKLESNSVTPGPKLSIAARGRETVAPDLADTLWLGCRLGSDGPRKARFRGMIDELVIIDRGLDPSEISRVMDGGNLVIE